MSRVMKYMNMRDGFRYRSKLMKNKNRMNNNLNKMIMINIR